MGGDLAAGPYLVEEVRVIKTLRAAGVAHLLLLVMSIVPNMRMPLLLVLVQRGNSPGFLPSG